MPIWLEFFNVQSAHENLLNSTISSVCGIKKHDIFTLTYETCNWSGVFLEVYLKSVAATLSDTHTLTRTTF